MASSLDFVEFLCEQISGCGDIRHRKMFGEYMIYLNEKPIFLICDDRLFVKILPSVSDLVGANAEQDVPYRGAKPHFVVTDLEDREQMAKLAKAVEIVTPLPKPKKKKGEQK